MNTGHPFRPGDRVFLPGTPSYGFKVFYGRVHYVERVWTDYSPSLGLSLRYLKLLGIQRPCVADGFILVKRAGVMAG